MVDGDMRGRVLRVRLQDSRSSAQHRLLGVGASPPREPVKPGEDSVLGRGPGSHQFPLGWAEGSTETCSLRQDHPFPRMPRWGGPGQREPAILGLSEAPPGTPHHKCDPEQLTALSPEATSHLAGATPIFSWEEGGLSLPGPPWGRGSTPGGASRTPHPKQPPTLLP